MWTDENMCCSKMCSALYVPFDPLCESTVLETGGSDPPILRPSKTSVSGCGFLSGGIPDKLGHHVWSRPQEFGYAHVSSLLDGIPIIGEPITPLFAGFPRVCVARGIVGAARFELCNTPPGILLLRSE